MTRTVTVQLTVADAKAWLRVAKASPKSAHVTAAEVFRAGLDQKLKALDANAREQVEQAEQAEQPQTVELPQPEQPKATKKRARKAKA